MTYHILPTAVELEHVEKSGSYLLSAKVLIFTLHYQQPALITRVYNGKKVMKVKLNCSLGHMINEQRKEIGKIQ
jgi:hypothetical protein